jgi:signal transduction histidine kinase
MSLSIIFQFLAAFWAIRLIKPSGAFIAWVLLACGFTIQGVRRIVSLTHVMNGQLSGDMTVEIMGLIISLLMLAGIWKFGPLFNEIREAHRGLTEKTLLLETEIDERQQIQEVLAAKSNQLEMLNTTLEQRITNALEELRQNDRLMINQSRQAAMGDMINNIAHQWRQPLNNIGLIVQSIRYDFDAGAMTSAQMTQEIDKCMEIISFMSQTINDFRNFFREDKQTSLFNVRERIENAIKLMSASLKHNHISVFLDSDADVEVNGLPNEFSQAILNLLANARDALLEREAALPKISININCTEPACVISVSDNAGGIPDDIFDHVFDPYFTTKEQGKGTGIGLYITKTIIEKHMGCSVSVHNRAEGAEFTITIPAQKGITA